MDRVNCHCIVKSGSQGRDGEESLLQRGTKGRVAGALTKYPLDCIYCTRLVDCMYKNISDTFTMILI